MSVEFEEYAHLRWATLVRSAVLLGASLDDAEDLAQTALLRCFKSWEKVQRAENIDAYVYRVLLNCLRDSKRRHWWRERPTPSLPEVADPMDAMSNVEIEDAVRRALGNLSKVNRAVVVLRFYASLTEPQIAQALRIPGGTVKSRLSRALKQLSSNQHISESQGRRNR